MASRQSKNILAFFFIAFCTIVTIYGVFLRHSTTPTMSAPIPSPSPSRSPISLQDTFLFVPYWARQLASPLKDPTYIDFSYRIDSEGTLDHDMSQLRLDTPYIAVRLTSHADVMAYLQHPELWQRTYAAVRELNRAHVVWDIELPLDIVGTGLETQYAQFLQEAHTALGPHIGQSIAIHGDTWLYGRPYPVEEGAPLVEHIFIMLYDLHKAGSEPGPLFPLASSQEFSYSEENLWSTIHTTSFVDKIVYVWGAYGYEWHVDARGNPITRGQARTAMQIATQVKRCATDPTCTIERKQGELHMNYQKNGDTYVLWGKDAEALTGALERAQQRGVSAAIWAAGYME